MFWKIVSNNSLELFFYIYVLDIWKKSSKEGFLKFL